MPEHKKTGILSLNVQKKQQKNNHLAFSLEQNLNIAVGEFIFRYTINPSANLK